MIEFALVLPLLLALLVGIVTAAGAWNRQNTLQHAAREAARLGATLDPWDAEAEDSVRAVIDRNLQMSGIDEGEVVACVDLGANPCGLDPAEVLTDESVGVVLVLAGQRLDFVLFSTSLTLDASAVARYER